MGSQAYAFGIEKSSQNNLLQILWDNTSDFVIEVDQDGNCLRLNKVFPEDSIEQLIGTNLFAKYLSVEQKIIWEKLKPKLLQQGSLEDLELTIDFANTILWQCKLFLLEPGNPCSTILILAKDVIQPNITQSTPLLSDKYHRNVFETIKDGIIVTDLLGNILEVNPAYSALMGYSRKELIGKKANSLIHPEFIQDIKNMRNQFLATGQISVESVQLHKDNKTKIPVEINSSIFTQHGRLSLLTVVRNISTRKEAELKLRLSEQRYCHLFNNSPDMVFTIDLVTEKVMDCNQTLLDKLGYTRDEIIGKSHFNYFDEKSISEGRLSFSNWLLDKEAYEAERIFLCRNKNKIPVWIKCSGMKNEMYNVLYVVARDKTERKALEQQMENLQREHHLKLAHVTRVSAMGEMATGLAHELNQPLSAITNYLHGCIRRLKNESHDVEAMTKAMELAVTESQRAANIIQSLREFVKKKKHQPQFLEIIDEIHEAINFVQFRSKHACVEIDCVGEKLLPKAYFDKIHFQQVIINLLNNAIDAFDTPASSDEEFKISIKIDYHETLNVFITDNGSGISKQAITKIFDPFYTTKAEGMGMGLAICHSIMEKNGGTLSLHQTGPAGTTFALTLPCKDI